MENSKTAYVSILFELGREERISFESIACDWVFRMTDESGKSKILYGYKFPVNDAAAASLCDDKGAVSELLTAHGIPNVPHRFFMSPSDIHYVGGQGNMDDMESLLREWGIAVIKPNFGTGGYMVEKIESISDLHRAAAQIFTASPALALSPYLEIDHEYRVVMMDGEARLIFEKIRPSVIGNGRETTADLSNKQLGSVPPDLMQPERIPADGEKVIVGWKHNLGQGAKALPLSSCDLTQALARLSAQTMQLLGLRFASVDIVISHDKMMILEINSGVMLEHFASEQAENYICAKEIYRSALRASF